MSSVTQISTQNKAAKNGGETAKEQTAVATAAPTTTTLTNTIAA